MRPWSVAVFFGVAVLALAEDPKDYPAAEAPHHVGESVTISDQITSVHQSSSGHISLDMGSHHSKPPLTVFIPSPVASAFPMAKKFEGRKVQVKGKIMLYGRDLEIVITDPSQIKDAK